MGDVGEGEAEWERVSILLSILQLFDGFEDCFEAILDGVQLAVDVGCIDQCHAHHGAGGRDKGAG